MAISNNSTGLRPGVCTSTTRPTAPYEGQTIYETNTDLTYIWGGSAWQQVSGGTAVGNSGLVFIASNTFTTSSAVNINNVFTSTYDSYSVIIRAHGTGNTIRWKFRAAGNDTTDSQYYTAGYTTNYLATSLTVYNTGNDPHFGIACNYGTNIAEVGTSLITVNNPAISASRTSCLFEVNNTSSATVYNLAGTHTPTAAYDGFSLIPATGTTTGTVTIYGYRKA